MSIRDYSEVSVAGKTVLLRCDLNVPLQDGKIVDETRIQESVATIRDLIDKSASVIIFSHLGRPKGKCDDKYSLRPIVDTLTKLLDRKVNFCDSSFDEKVRYASSDLRSGEVLLLENVRFNLEETSKDGGLREEIARFWASLADVYIDDAFGVVHRKHASVYDVAKIMPSYAGQLLLKEVSALSYLQDNPSAKYTVILGGSKVSDKLRVIDGLIGKADNILIGGGMAFTFLKAKGYEIGKSLVEEELLETVQEFIQKSQKTNTNLVLPVDLVAAKEFSAQAKAKIVDLNEMPKDFMGLDIGPKTASIFSSFIDSAQTIFWNGPLGVFEWDSFSNGSKAIAHAVANSSAHSVIGGGDTISAINTFGISHTHFSHVSTGGGASLEFLEGKDLPGLVVLRS